MGVGPRDNVFLGPAVVLDGPEQSRFLYDRLICKTLIVVLLLLAVHCRLKVRKSQEPNYSDDDLLTSIDVKSLNRLNAI